MPATQALREGKDELNELSRLAADAPATAKPLRQLLQSLDDRKRAIDNDPRAKVNGPPATDPSYGGGRGGFTGFESIANYFFWQVMSTNVFDEIGHLLRVGATVNKCSPFQNDVTRQAAARGLQLVARAAPAGHQRARPRPALPRGDQRREALGEAREQARRAPRPRRARRGAGARPARHLQAAGGRAALRGGPAEAPARAVAAEGPEPAGDARRVSTRLDLLDSACAP